MAEDFDAKLQVLRHPPDHRELLEILLAEDRDVGANGAEQLGHHGGDAVEMPGPSLPVPAIAQALDADRRGETRRIHVLSLGQPQQVATRLLQHLGVLLLLPRVAVEVLVRPELQRIDENGGDNPIRAAPRFLDQGDVPGMQRAHGRNERQALAAGPQRDQCHRQLRGLTD